MTRRDYIAEIIQKRSRLKKRSQRWDQMTKRLDALIDISDFIHKSKVRNIPFRSELAKYVPIGFVACVEGYFRLVFRDLIDFGSPFRDNAAGFKEMRFRIDDVVAIHGGHLSLGEFISHLLPTNGVDDLNSSMSILIGEPFLERLKRTKADFFSERKESLEETDLADALLSDLGTLFEHRHIFSHELATRLRVSVPTVRSCSQASLIFMWATEALITELLGAPNKPLHPTLGGGAPRRPSAG